MNSRQDESTGPAPEHIERHDEWARYECARHQLVIATLRLSLSGATTRQLRHFVTAALALRDACNSHHVPNRPIDVLLWLRRRLNQEAKKAGRNGIYRANCLGEIARVEREIGNACVALSQGRLEVLE